jgi:multiple sugar transport system ATP-binding protein
VSPQGSLAGRVELVEELGENHLLYVELGQGRRLTVREPGGARHAMGTTVTLDLVRESCHLFRHSGEALPPRAGRSSPAPSSPDLTSSAA